MGVFERVARRASFTRTRLAAPLSRLVRQFVEFGRFDGFFEEAYLDKLRIQNVADPSARFLDSRVVRRTWRLD